MTNKPVVGPRSRALVLAEVLVASAVAGGLVLGLVAQHDFAQTLPATRAQNPPDALYAELSAALDTFDRGGRWKETDSAMLGWSCGQELQALVYMYQASGDRQWLDRLFKYSEAMFANLTPNRDGFLSWRSRRYSRAYARTERAEKNVSKVQLDPTEQWVPEPAVGTVNDAVFRLVAQKAGSLQVQSADGAETAPAIDYEVGTPFSAPFGIRLTLNGNPAEGDTFTLTTRAPKDFDYAVHDGMVLMPICRAIELVKNDRALATAYGGRAAKLLEVIETQLIPKWDKYWRETKTGGVYVYPDDPSFDPRNGTPPHNQYLPLGTAQVTLYRITGKPAYRERAAKLASFFRSCLRTVDGHYDWNYWDAAGEWDAAEKSRAEDTGHGSLDVGFVLACAGNGIVFTDADLQRLADTLVHAMWNGSADKPAVGGWVNTTQPSRESVNLQEWLLLRRVEPRVGKVCEPVILADGSLWAKAQLYWLRSQERGR